MSERERLYAKYEAERVKRVRSDGIRQYVAVDVGKGWDEDPFTERIDRDPIRRDVEVAITGAGWSGLAAAVHLRKQGVDDFLILDRAGDFGGTWYWNRYPGIACDIDSYTYLPFLEEVPDYVPSMFYAPGEEIRAHAQSVARRFDLYENSLFQTVAEEFVWDEATTRWIITTDRGDEIRARFVVIGTGILSRPKLPGIPGVETFKGHAFHASRWDFDYTGGSTSGGLDKLAGKKVAIIGTGATALQAVPRLAESGAELFVFQRTPLIVGPRHQRPTDESWYRSLEPGWQLKRLQAFEAQLAGIPVEEQLDFGYWTEIIGRPGLPVPADGSEPDLEAYSRLLEEVDVEQLNRIRARVDELVHDPRNREALKPWYGRFCKRPSFSDEYLQSFNRPNVHLVDTDGRGVDEITERGVVMNGQEYPVDLIIYATGFESAVHAHRSGGFEVYGTDGTTLSEAWKVRVRSVHGIQAHGFPNLYIVGGGRQQAISASVALISVEQARFVATNIAQLQNDGIVRQEVTADTVQEWIDTVEAYLPLVFNAEATSRCTPSYYNQDGVWSLDDGGAKGRPPAADMFGAGPFEYFRILEAWNSDKQYLGKSAIAGPGRQAGSTADALQSAT